MRIQQLPYGDAVCRVSPLNKPQLIKETLEWKSTLVRDPLAVGNPSQAVP